MKEKKNITEIIELPEGIEARKEANAVIAKGPKGEVRKVLVSKQASIKIEGREIKIVSLTNTKKDKKIIGSFKAHIKNLIRGAAEGYEYKMKICSGHFPMTVSVDSKEFVVKNFIGEKLPRRTPALEGVQIKIEGDEITLTGLNKETVSQMSANIEQLCKRTGFDRRRFQDGIYITSKAGKKMGK